MACTTSSESANIDVRNSSKDEVVENPEIHFEPIVKLNPVELKTNEENEEEIFRMRAKLYRFDMEASPPEWKERGVGDVKFLRHKNSNNVRLLMRREKTHKICANHYITKDMSLMPSAGSDKAWVWTVQADFADEEAKVEQLAIRFKTAEDAQMFSEKFNKCQSLSSNEDADDLAQKVEGLTVEETPNAEPAADNSTTEEAKDESETSASADKEAAET